MNILCGVVSGAECNYRVDRTPMVMNNSIEKGMKTFTDAPKEVQSQYIDPRPQLSEGERLVQNSAEVYILRLL